MSNADELMVSEKTAYNYLNAGLFDADKMDCPRIIRMRPRRSTPKLNIDRHCYEGRTYEDFMRFIADNPDVPVVQMDSVIGNKSGKVLLTIAEKQQDRFTREKKRRLKLQNRILKSSSAKRNTVLIRKMIRMK